MAAKKYAAAFVLVALSVAVAIALVTIALRRARAPATEPSQEHGEDATSREGGPSENQQQPQQQQKSLSPYRIKKQNGGCGCGKKKLDPVTTSSYNGLQMVKQSILLEDHLNHPRKRCTDCIAKHMLTLSALAEEAVSLVEADADIERNMLQETTKQYDELFESWREGRKEPHELARQLRQIRKRLMRYYLGTTEPG